VNANTRRDRKATKHAARKRAKELLSRAGQQRARERAAAAAMASKQTQSAERDRQAGPEKVVRRLCDGMLCIARGKMGEPTRDEDILFVLVPKDGKPLSEEQEHAFARDLAAGKILEPAAIGSRP
jgi:septal ring factor EnvC (AmiA/AmiB activator)